MQIKESDAYLETIYFYRQHHTKLPFLLAFFLLILGLPLILYGSPIVLIFLSPLFVGLLWVSWGRQRLFVSRSKIEMSELIGPLPYQKKVLSTGELESSHLHYATVHDCTQGTDEVVFDGLVFTTKDNRQWKPFHYLDETESQRLLEKLKGFLNLRNPARCPCTKLKEP